MKMTVPARTHLRNIGVIAARNVDAVNSNGLSSNRERSDMFQVWVHELTLQLLTDFRGWSAVVVNRDVLRGVAIAWLVCIRVEADREVARCRIVSVAPRVGIIAGPRAISGTTPGFGGCNADGNVPTV